MPQIPKRKLLTLCLLCQPPRILLGMKKRGFGAGNWNGFGGKLEANETIEDAARREFLEEAGIKIQDLNKRGILEFEFENSPHEILEVHVFKATQYTGTPVESDEMKPQWFEIEKIPFDQMWPDDIFWFPAFLKDQKFIGKFRFDLHDKMTSHEVTIVEKI